MKNRITPAGTAADSSTKPKLKRQAKLLPSPLLAAVLKNSLLIFGVFILIVGNALCYYYNNRPLKPLTDIVAVFIIIINFRKR